MYSSTYVPTYIHTHIFTLLHGPPVGTEFADPVLGKPRLTCAWGSVFRNSRGPAPVLGKPRLTCTWGNIYTYVLIYLRTYIHTHIHTYTHTDIDAHTYIYPYIHTHIHTCIDLSSSARSSSGDDETDTKRRAGGALQRGLGELLGPLRGGLGSPLALFFQFVLIKTSFRKRKRRNARK